MKHIKSFERISRGKEVIHTLNTKAKSKQYEYTVDILQGESKYDTLDGLILSIDTTPGSWYVSTFLENPGNEISISGNDWICTNKQEITKELKAWLENEYPMWKDSKKYNV